MSDRVRVRYECLYFVYFVYIVDPLKSVSY